MSPIATIIGELSFHQWVAGLGALFLLVGLSSPYLKRLPISTSAIYLLLGVAIGPRGLHWVSLDLVASSDWIERVTEGAVTLALFIGGLKMRLPLHHPAWVAAIRLAAPVMIVSIACLWAFERFAFGLEPAHALLVAATLAPTDPVLAGAVTVSDAADKDRMRFGLSGEAGFNDGSAFPFVFLSLTWMDRQTLGPWLFHWVLHRVIWAIPVGLVIGFALGRGIGELAVILRSRTRDTNTPSDFLALALIGLSYVVAEEVGALGFLSVFAAGVGLRSAELKVVNESPHPRVRRWAKRGQTHPPAEDLVAARIKDESVKEPAVAAGVFVAETILFGDTLERLLEVLLVAIVGVALAPYFNWQGVLLALVLFLLVRPLSARLLLNATATTNRQRWLMGWFGIRGIGSLYYLTFALNRGVTGPAALRLAELTITVIACSIVLHGVSAQPLLSYYERTLVKSGRARLSSAP